MSEGIPFWLVWRHRGSSPVFKHQSESRAITEATRLAKENPGVQFFVLAPTVSVEIGGVNVRRFEADQVPF